VLELHHHDLVLLRDIDLPDDAHQALNVVRVIADDDDVRLRDGGELTVLGRQRPQDLHELRRIDVLRRHDARHHLLRGDLVQRTLCARCLLARGVGHDSHHVPGRHGHKVVNPQHGQEQRVHGILVHGRAGDDGHVALDPRVDDEGLAGDGGNLGDKLLKIRVLDVDLPGLLLGGNFTGCDGQRQGDRYR
jgi:hypothetical protein